MTRGRRWTVRDRSGNEIYLTEERWQHIIEPINHPEMAAYGEQLKAVIRSGRRKQDALNPQKYRYSPHYRCPSAYDRYKYRLNLTNIHNRDALSEKPRMTAQPERYISEEVYLDYERSSAIKHEYFHGRVYAMTGAKESHNLIAANTLASLHSQLRRKPCRVYPGDMRVKVLRTGLNTYPDVVVVCGQPQFTDDVRDTITNPTIIVEVLSPSTERYDRGMKFQNYRTIDTLRDYILISQDHHHIEHYTRQENDQWLLQEITSLEEKIYIQSIECTLLLEDVYEKVELEQDTGDLPRDIPLE